MLLKEEKKGVLSSGLLSPPLHYQVLNPTRFLSWPPGNFFCKLVKTVHFWPVRKPVHRPLRSSSAASIQVSVNSANTKHGGRREIPRSPNIRDEYAEMELWTWKVQRGNTVFSAIRKNGRRRAKPLFPHQIWFNKQDRQLVSLYTTIWDIHKM